MSTIIEIVSFSQPTSVQVNGFVGLPAGGTTGQSLVKNSNTPYDVSWSNSGGNTPTLISSYNAANTIPIHSAVILTSTGADIASSSNVTHASKVIGISSTSALQNTTISVATSGDIIEPSWTWIEGNPIYLASNGSLTQTPPTSGFILQVGMAATPIKMLIQIKFPIIL